MQRNLWILLLFSFTILSSCKKPISIKPALTISNLNKDAAAGDQVPFDINSSGPKSIARLKVDINVNNSGLKTLTDTTYPSPFHVLQYEYYYTIPADAVKDESIVLTFTVYDTDGNSSSSTKTITVKGAQPFINFTSSANTGAPGGVISLQAGITSASRDLGKGVLTQSINSSTPATIATRNWQDQNSVTWDYVYNIPQSAKSGDNIVLEVAVTNNDGVVRSKKVSIKVQ
jgi:hypothetical protein